MVGYWAAHGEEGRRYDAHVGSLARHVHSPFRNRIKTFQNVPECSGLFHYSSIMLVPSYMLCRLQVSGRKGVKRKSAAFCRPERRSVYA